MARVIVVDDDPVVRAMVLLVLTEAGHEVAEACDGRQALRELRRQPADVVLTDVLMPEVDGLELIRAVRREFPAARVVAMSGGSARMPGTDMLQLAQALGAHRVLPKPFRAAEVLDAVRPDGAQ